MANPTHALVRFIKNNPSNAASIVEVDCIKLIKRNKMKPSDSFKPKELYDVKKVSSGSYESACIYLIGCTYNLIY